MCVSLCVCVSECEIGYYKTGRSLTHSLTHKGVTSPGTHKSFSQQETKIDCDDCLYLSLPLAKSLYFFTYFCFLMSQSLYNIKISIHSIFSSCLFSQFNKSTHISVFHNAPLLSPLSTFSLSLTLFLSVCK